MPIYEYECTSCHHQFDLMQKISDTPAKQCPRCLENTAVRLVSAAGFQLKGTGWYATDFKNKGKQENKKTLQFLIIPLKRPQKKKDDCR
ncbi:FmdB family zinc ribbon protein [Legionella tunisiensis]|uniref:FmdB family zinc ribbon protein n=1 Tax=Legionella tunisiensis TaxID=1034944 RepID=UPI0002DF5BDD|nr:zinc ribbon domain-containing protein [Legionella tunisiensis]